MIRSLLIAAAACLLASSARAQVHLTLDANTTITLGAITPSNAANLVNGINANAPAGTQFDPRLIPGGSGGGGDPEVTIENERLYPVFILPMGPGFYDFELKATITNFAAGQANAPLTSQMVYWTASAIDYQPSQPMWDSAPTIFFTSGKFSDPRVWLGVRDAGQSLNTGSTINQIIVFPSKIAGSAAWMYKGNTKLVWSYVRISATGFERDNAGNVVWNPVLPVDWRIAVSKP